LRETPSTATLISNDWIRMADSAFAPGSSVSTGEHQIPLCDSGATVRQLREKAFNEVDRSHYDVAIFGGGISGARLFHELCRHGHRVLLLDRGDFAGGTSQASGMMIWGGLLYLRQFDFRTVIKLCRARDDLIEQLPATIHPASIRYLPGRKNLRPALVHAIMLMYWLLGSPKRLPPRSDASFDGLSILKRDRFERSFVFQEAVLKASDSRFVLDWILPFAAGETTALNHCAAENVRFDASCKEWRLELRDALHGCEASVAARFIVNAAGVWTDTLNHTLGIESPYRHELSKGAYISFQRPELLRQILVFDTGANGDTITFTPWGSVAMWGPTETRLDCIGDGFCVRPDDVRSLLNAANQNLHLRHGVDSIVSMRCGIRSLAVKNGYSKIVHPLNLSRKHLIHRDADRQAIVIYGGKLSSSGLLADEVRRSFSQRRKQGGNPSSPTPQVAPTQTFPGMAQEVGLPTNDGRGQSRIRLSGEGLAHEPTVRQGIS
jgi:glycerol-3-phosphate dehydrogenase